MPPAHKAVCNGPRLSLGFAVSGGNGYLDALPDVGFYEREQPTVTVQLDQPNKSLHGKKWLLAAAFNKLGNHLTSVEPGNTA